MNADSQDSEMAEERETPPIQAEQEQEPSVNNKVIHFRCNKEKYAVSCKPSMTVLEALNRSTRFRGIRLKNNDKELVIQREKFPKAVVNIDFPCCLIDEPETLDVSFIKSEARSPTAPNNLHVRTWEDLVSFNIRTKGGKNIRQIMKNQELKLEFDFVCVHAKRGESVRKALKRDGRFTDVIFSKRCAVIEVESEVITEMSTGVDHLDGKHLQVIRFEDSNQVSEVSDATPSGSQVENINPRRGVHTKRNTSLRPEDVTAILQACKSIPNSEMLYTTLSSRFGNLMKVLKTKSKGKSYSSVLRVEYDKGANSFSKIRDFKRLMQLSDSVCKIVIDEEALGTGFLLFDKFILTCAHVIDCNAGERLRKLKERVTAEFDYEDNKTKQVFQVKEDIVSCSHEVGGQGPFLDFALLELGEPIPEAGGSASSAEAATPTPPALLKDPPCPANAGVTKGICIIGHPDCRSKKLDICSVISDSEWRSTASDRLSQMSDDTLHVVSEMSLQEDWNYNNSQITYDTCFFHGSSGSPVFNKRCEVIGIHTGGYAYKDDVHRFHSLMEYAFPIGPVIKRIIKQSEETGRNDVLTVLESLGIKSDTGTTATDPHTTPLQPLINSVQDEQEDISANMTNLTL